MAGSGGETDRGSAPCSVTTGEALFTGEKMLRDEQLRLSTGDTFRVGDVVVYHLSEYERHKALKTLEEIDSRKYGPRWSLPVRVKEVQEKTLKVQHLLGARKDFRVVPRSKVRRLVGEIPDSLVRQAYGNLGVEAPEVDQGLKNLRFEENELACEDETVARYQQTPVEKDIGTAEQQSVGV
eukprot:GHVS01106939.1.p2 GENE.GHVS01106939.1~~GHVS01106939.1.p2  ORF type:complete len:181 (+),score=19.49 GHVS01106939.1:480-1022(+)